jgi:hypothetical protein
VLDPAGPREELPVLALCDGHDGSGRVEHDAPRRRGSLIDGGDEVLHATILP